MRLTWQGEWGFDERGYLAVSLAYYDEPQGWAVFITQQRLDGGPWPTQQAAAEAAVADLPAGPAQPSHARRPWER